MAALLLKKGQVEEALKAATDDLDAARAKKNVPEIMEALAVAVGATAAKGLGDDALRLASTEVSQQELAKDKAGHALALLILADAQMGRGKADEASKTAELSRSLFFELKDLNGQGRAWQCKARAALACDRFSEAEAAAKEALTQLGQAKNQLVIANGWVLVAEVRAAAGRHGYAITASKEALKNFKEAGGDKEGVARAQAVHATALVRKGHFEAAAAAGREAVKGFREAGILQGSSAAASALAEALVGTSSAEALRVTREQLSITRLSGDMGEQAEALAGNCRISEQAGEYDEALESGVAARDLFKDLGRIKEQAAAELVLARLFVGYEMMDEALGAANAGLRIYQKLGDKSGESDAVAVLTEVRLARRETPPTSAARSKALAQLREAANAVKRDDPGAFKEVFDKLDGVACIGQADIDGVLMPAFSEDPERAHDFIREYAELVKTGMAADVEFALSNYVPDDRGITGVNTERNLCYIMTRYGGMGFGPSFRCVHLNYCPKLAQGGARAIISAVKMNNDAYDNWETMVQTHPGIMDTGLHGMTSSGNPAVTRPM